MHYGVQGRMPPSLFPHALQTNVRNAVRGKSVQRCLPLPCLTSFLGSLVKNHALGLVNTIHALSRAAPCAQDCLATSVARTSWLADINAPQVSIQAVHVLQY